MKICELIFGAQMLSESSGKYVFYDLFNSDENMNKFVEEINGVLNGEIEINANKLRLEDLEDSDFTPVQMMALEAFVEE